MKPFHLLLVASLFCAACGDPATSAGAPPHATAPSPKAQVPAAAAVVPEPVAPRELPMDSGPGVGPIPAPAGEAGPAAAEIAPPPAPAIPVAAEPSAPAPAPQDEPKPEPKPPAPDPRPAPPADAAAPPAAKPAAAAAEDPDADAKAREILTKAAERQNAGELAEPGRLESFHVVFHKATFEREKADATGHTSSQLVETDEDGLVFDWKQGSIKTSVVIDGSTTTKAWYDPKKTGWISDGQTVSSLLGSDHRTDYDQLQFHRTVINQLLDVAILGKMLRDKSRWKVIRDSAPYEKTIAMQRIPPADAPGAAAITLWVDHPSADALGDVVAAAVPATETGGATIFYRFSYHETFPAVRLKTGDAEPAGSKVRFPFGVSVYEQLPNETSPRKVLEVFTKSVDINTVVDKDFAPPKAR